MTDKIIITNWNLVSENDFYLSEDWINDETKLEELLEMAKNEQLYQAYIALAVHY